MPESQVSAAAGTQMLAGAKGPKREGDPQEAGPGEAWGEASKSAKGKEQQLGPPWPDEAPSMAGKRQLGHPSAPHKASVKGPYA